ncbi:hypothetical protein EDB84DRAFT_1492780, partial [Lactarius hengduanensis]
MPSRTPLPREWGRVGPGIACPRVPPSCAYGTARPRGKGYRGWRARVHPFRANGVARRGKGKRAGAGATRRGGAVYPRAPPSARMGKGGGGRPRVPPSAQMGKGGGRVPPFRAYRKGPGATCLVRPPRAPLSARDAGVSACPPVFPFRREWG